MRPVWPVVGRRRRRSHLAALLLLIAMPAEATIITGGFSMAGGLAPGQDFSGPGTVNVDPQSMIVLPGTIVGDFASDEALQMIDAAREGEMPPPMGSRGCIEPPLEYRL